LDGNDRIQNCTTRLAHVRINRNKHKQIPTPGVETACSFCNFFGAWDVVV
jgi:hypothetical protein